MNLHIPTEIRELSYDLSSQKDTQLLAGALLGVFLAARDRVKE